MAIYGNMCPRAAPPPPRDGHGLRPGGAGAGAPTPRGWGCVLGGGPEPWPLAHIWPYTKKGQASCNMKPSSTNFDNHFRQHVLAMLHDTIPQNRVYRPKNMAKNNCCFVFWCFNVIIRFIRVLIIPKWLINDS